MKLGIHFMNFTHPDGGAALRAAVGDTAVAADEAGIVLVHRDGPLVPDGALPDRVRPDARGLLGAELRRGEDRAAAARPARHRRHLPLPGPARQDRHHARRAVRRPGDARHRRGLVRARAPRARRAVPAGRRAVRAPRGDASRSASRCGATTTARTRASTTSWRRRSASPQPLQRAAPADPHRRGRGEEDAAPGREVRRRVQPVRLVAADVATSSTCCAGTATPRAATTTRSRRRSSGRVDPGDARATSSRRWRSTPSSASTWSRSRPTMPDPARFVTLLGEKVVRPLAEIG